MSLREYVRKRTFSGVDGTSEPRRSIARGGPKAKRGRAIFVVQLHHARSRHYDFRLELDGVLKSWAVPKGVSLDPSVRRLAVEVEDHPIAYADFQGDIPQGHYGAGHVELFDRGTWSSDADARRQLDKGHLRFTLNGERLRGEWNLVRTQRAARQPQWLLMKIDDQRAAALPADDSIEQPRTASPAKTRAPKKTNAGKRTVMPHGAFAAQLCSLSNAAPTSDEWLHEVKWDGYRLLATIEGKKVRLWSRNAIEWTAKLPEIIAALKTLKLSDSRLDGELVALRDDRADFNLLKARLSGENDAALAYQLFDLPYLSGRDLADVALTERKALLEKILERHPHRALRYSAHVIGGGASAFEQAVANGLEGVVSKRLESPYRGGRGGDWVKTKGRHSDEFLVVGFTAPKGSRTALGSLLLARVTQGQLSYAGRCGTGFDDAMLRQLRQRLQTHTLKQAPLDVDQLEPRVKRTVRWVEPELVVEIFFGGLGGQGLLRHPAFKAIREDKSAADLFNGDSMTPPVDAQLKPSRRATRAKPVNTDAEVRITHPERLMFADVGISKAAVADYYRSVMPWFLPSIANRPLAVVRCPDGVGHETFFQKHPGRGWGADIFPAAKPKRGKAEPYLYVKDAAGVLQLVQMNVIEFHAWASTVEDPAHAEYVVFDLDPDAGVSFKRLTRAAVDLRELLHGIGLRSFVRTTGGKGLHVVVPLAPAASWEQAKTFAHAVASTFAQSNPKEFVDVANKHKRRDRIFIDWLRNGRGATSVASYSLRARPGAKTAVPISWDELAKLKRSDPFDLKSTKKRLAAMKRDPWHDMLTVKQSLDRLQDQFTKL